MPKSTHQYLPPNQQKPCEHVTFENVDSNAHVTRLANITKEYWAAVPLSERREVFINFWNNRPLNKHRENAIRGLAYLADSLTDLYSLAPEIKLLGIPVRVRFNI